MGSRHDLQVDESPLKRLRGGPLRECQAQNELSFPDLAICNRKRRASGLTLHVPELSSRGSSPPICPSGKLPRNDSNGAVVGAALQQVREQRVEQLPRRLQLRLEDEALQDGGAGHRDGHRQRGGRRVAALERSAE